MLRRGIVGGTRVVVVLTTFAVVSFPVSGVPLALGAGAAAWPQPQLDGGRTSYNESETTLTPSAVGDATLVMKRRFNRSRVNAPMVGEGGLFVPLFGGWGNDRLVRLDLEGRTAWGQPLDCQWQDPVVIQPVVIERASGCSVTNASSPSALRARDGVHLWWVPGSGQEGSCVLAAEDRVLSVTGGDPYNDPYVLHANDPATGAQVWTYGPFDPFDSEMGCPVVSGGIVFVTLGDGLRAVDLESGTELWAQKGFGRNLQALAARGDTVFLRYVSDDSPTGEFRLMAFDTGTRSALWDQEIPSFNWVYGLAVGDGKVFVATSTGLLALDAATGVEVWKYAGIPNPLGPPTGAGGVVYMQDALAKGVVAIDASDGTLIRVFPGRGRAVVVGGRLYIGSRKGLLRVWSAKPTPPD